jgi:hypothetical protein
MNDYLRQLGILSPNQIGNTKLTMIGVGGIGSFTTFTLSKMGIKNITVYDHDTVENHNLPNQLYRSQDLGKSKVDSISEIVTEFTGFKTNPKKEKYTNQPLSGIVVSGVDSMACRKEIWENIKFDPKIDIYIDARIGGEVCRIYSIKPCDPDDIRLYEKTLCSEEKVANLPCTSQSIIYIGTMVSSLISIQVKKYLTGQPLSKEVIFDAITLSLITS